MNKNENKIIEIRICYKNKLYKRKINIFKIIKIFHKTESTLQVLQNFQKDMNVNNGTILYANKNACLVKVIDNIPYEILNGLKCTFELIIIKDGNNYRTEIRVEDKQRRITQYYRKFVKIEDIEKEK